MILKRDCLFTPTGKNRPLHIWLPEDYEQSEERYPVMYFFDGHNLFNNEDATYGKSWGLKEFLEGWSKPMIIVGIECGHEGEERLREYLPYAATGEYFGKIDGIGDATVRWMVEVLKPEIDREFRTWPFRECTAIAGSSMGGLMALFGAVHYNRWFSKAACISSALGICMGPLMKDMTENPMDPDTRLYLSWGTREAYGLEDPTREDRSSHTYQWNLRVWEQAQKVGASAKLVSQVGGNHCEADWEKLVPDFMEYLWMQ